ncbi:MAG: hypothetical protein ABIS06_03070, partial [Vicinamibacterales bacterium]
MLLLVALFAVSLPAVTARLYSSDEVQYFSYLRSLWFDHDLSFDNEYRYFYDNRIAQSEGYHETFLERQTETGRRFNYGTIGCAILWSPFYGIADIWTRLSGSAPADGFSRPYVRAVAYGSAFYGFLAILLSVRAARMLLGDRGPLAAGLAAWVGTPLLFYMYVAPPFSHACSAFSVAVFVSVWLQVRKVWSPAGTFALALSAALMAMVREQDVFLALGPALDFVTRLPGLKSAVTGMAGFVIGDLPQLVAYTSLNGFPRPASHVARKMSWYAPHGLQVLFSTDHGFFVWTPLALVALAGLLFYVTDRRVAAWMLLMVATQVYVAGSVESWTVAGAFGQRRFVCLTIFLTIGIAALLNAMRGAGRAVALAATLVLAWWNVALMAQFATGTMDRQRLEPARNAYTAFVTLPLETPALIQR